jgi:uncharacterized caspase-like protein
MLRALVVVILIVLLPAHACAEGKIALLIGNEAYGNEIGRLANPHNDVALLEQALKGLGFEVTVARDTSLGALTRAFNAYARRVQAAGPGAIGFFYYSGHGASDGGTNYLIPVDVKTAETGELWDQSMQLTEITRKLKRDASNATHFVVFDACRNTLKLTQPGSRAVVQSKGFVPVAQENGMLIAYATAEGELATDVGDGAGPYAKALAEEIIKPDIEAVAMFRNVQRRVRAAIKQEPYLGFSALGDVYFGGKLVVPAPRPIESPIANAAREWQDVKDTMSIVVLERYLQAHKNDRIYAALAQNRIDTLRRTQQAKGESGGDDRCSNMAGIWTLSWKGVLGPGSVRVVLKPGGTAMRSDETESGKWACTGGELIIAWADKHTDRGPVSADRKRVGPAPGMNWSTFVMTRN